MTIIPNAPSPRVRRDRWDWAFLIVSLLVTAWAFYDALQDYFSAAANRQSLQFSDLRFLLLGCAAWLIPLAFAAVLLIARRPPLSRACTYLAIALIPIVVGFSAHWIGGPGQSYRGYKQWITREVHPDPIQAWLQKQKPTPDIILLAPAAWPPEIQQLHPERVDLWRDRGIVLTWGRVGHDGDRRQVFIGRTAATPPPTEVLWIDDNVLDAWTPIKDHWPADWESITPSVWSWKN